MARTILIVGDNALDRTILNGFLKLAYTIIEVKSGVEMISVLREKGKFISAILLDLVMPEMDGFEALQKISENAIYRQIPVIVVSVQNDDETQVRALSLGAAGFAFKPYNKDILLHLLKNTINLREKSALANTFSIDPLTGILNRTAFFQKSASFIKAHEAGYYVLSCFDIENFKVINDQYGLDMGDKILKKIAMQISKTMVTLSGICCHDTADKFAMLYPAAQLESDEIKKLHKEAMSSEFIGHTIRIRVGRYFVNDLSLPVSTMYDRSTIAEESIKGRYDIYIAEYTEEMRLNLVNEQHVVNEMSRALEAGEFEPWFQPQYNHATGALIGAEALVRWKKNGKIVPPDEFIPIFERNGFIYKVDQYIWQSVCVLLRRWIDEGKNPMPVSVNISRYDLLQKDFMDKICSLTQKYKLPTDMLRLEVTESAFSEATNTIFAVVNALIDKGFTVEIDDFGSGYSSLNTLKDVQASILKLDMRFFEKSGDAKRGGNIVESIVRMAKWLGMAVIAEGVEDKEQADYLKSIGCYYIQGYYYAKPIPVDEYEKRLNTNSKEAQLNHLQTLKTLNNNDFWDSHSMDTLIFNSYVGAACIIEYTKGKIEMLRATDMYITMLGSTTMNVSDALKLNWTAFLDTDNICRFSNAVMESIETKKTVTDEFVFSGLPGCPDKVHLIAGLRVIATVGERILIYCLNNNITAQREAEQERLESARKLEIIMNNVNGGVSAIKIHDDGTSEFIFSNEKYYELYGYTRTQAQAENLDVMSLILPEDIDSVMEKIKSLKLNKKPVIIDYSIKKRDGSRALLRANASLMSFPGYGDDVITSVITDITEKRSLEDQLRAIVDNIYGAVSATYIDEDGHPQFVVVNDQFFHILGYATREEYEADHLDKYAGIHPDDRERIIRQFETSDGGKTQYTMDYRVVRKDGKIRYMRNNISVINMFGIDLPVQLSVANDITNQKEAEIKQHNITVQMQTIMANIQGGVTATVLRDENNIDFVFANDGFYEMYGYTREQMAAEMPNVLDLMLPEDRKMTMETVARIVKNRGSETYIYRCRKRDGSIIWTKCTNSVISIEGVGDTVLLGVSFDITKEHEAEMEKTKALDRLNTVMNAMPNGMTAVAFHNDGMKFLFANNRYYEMHGIHRGDIGEDHLSDVLNLVVRKYRNTLRNAIYEVVETGKTVCTEYQIRRPDGVIRWVRTNISMTKLADIDNPVQVSIFDDITAEKESAAQLRFLNKSAGEILAQPNSEKAINNTLCKLQNYFSSDRTYIFELNDGTQTSDNTYEICAPGVTSKMDRFQGVPYLTQQYWFDTINKAGFVAIPDVTAITDEHETNIRGLLLSQNIRSIIVAPLWRDDRMIGYIGIDNPTKAVDQVSQLIALTDYIAVLLTRRDLMKSIEYGRQTVQQLMDDTPGGFLRLQILSDNTPVIVSLNVGFCRILGMTSDEVMAKFGDDAHKCLVSEDVATVKNEAVKSLAGNGIYTYKCRLKKKDGTIIWVQVFGRYVKDENGKLFRNSYFTDITEQKNADQLQIDLLDNLPFGAAMYDYDGNTLTAIHINKSYWKLVKRDAIGTVIDAIHPDDRMTVIQEIEASIRQKRNPEANCRVLCGDGSYIPFHVLGTIKPNENGHWILYLAYSAIDKDIIPVY